jgi:putative membrane protein
MTTERKKPYFMIASALGALLGIALMVGLAINQGMDNILQAFSLAGWGIAVITAFHLLPMIAAALGWHFTSNSVNSGKIGVFIWARLVREAVNGLLPVAQIGGDFVGARILTFYGIPARIAVATVLIDFTIEFLTQVVFTTLGVTLLLLGGHIDFKDRIILGMVVAIFASVGFIIAQRYGMFRLLEKVLAKIATKFDLPGLGTFASLNITIMSMYKNWRAISLSVFWHFGSWLLSAAEVWLTLMFFGVDISFADALIIESLGQAIRSCAFLVPGAFGIQEGGYMFLGMLFGISPEFALSVSLIKRVRELVLGIPPILIWNAMEGRKWLYSAK